MPSSMTELAEVLQHAQLAHFDNELTSFVILIITNKKEPELLDNINI